jgi:hypothetical protein
VTASAWNLEIFSIVESWRRSRSSTGNVVEKALKESESQKLKRDSTFHFTVGTDPSEVHTGQRW